MDFDQLKEKISSSNAILVAVSKTHPPEGIRRIYDLGQRDFGENKVQELLSKVNLLPDDIRWHMIGHLQSNKVKYLVPFVHLIHSLDRISLAKEINKEGQKVDRVISTLLQIKIADEETKFGLEPDLVDGFLRKFQNNHFTHIQIAGVMGMATYTDDEELIKSEFRELEKIFTYLRETYFKDNSEFALKSYGMSSDYDIALATGSNIVRIGSLIFGERHY